jgi:hypothetical protein
MKNPTQLPATTLSQQKAFAIFDGLEAVHLQFMLGTWKGRELHTGHPMEGMLDLLQWYGKEFVDYETVHPLLCRTKHDKFFYANPGLMPFDSPLFRKCICGHLPMTALRIISTLILPLVHTKRSKARIRMIEHRGIVSAAMIYDQLGICDVFRKLDENTVLGVMDLKGEHQLGYFFVLERVVKSSAN